MYHIYINMYTSFHIYMLCRVVTIYHTCVYVGADAISIWASVMCWFQTFSENAERGAEGQEEAEKTMHPQHSYRRRTQEEARLTNIAAFKEDLSIGHGPGDIRTKLISSSCQHAACHKWQRRTAFHINPLLASYLHPYSCAVMRMNPWTRLRAAALQGSRYDR